ncbi:hypothetical protein AB0P37_08455 [Streptomyces antimycoticus]|uniref:hypothetical protein n=1 Tax=Streptomyces antimycoticus TaxID=68175 RepID=UPI0034496C5F
MNRIAITNGQLETALRAVVESSPDHVYSAPVGMSNGNGTCFYVHRTEDGTKTPGCLVGHALHRLGVPLATLEKWEGTSATGVIEGITTLDECASAVQLANEAQMAQDTGQCWSESLATAERDVS